MNLSRFFWVLVALLLLLASVPATAGGFGNAKKVMGVIEGEVYWLSEADDGWDMRFDCPIPDPDPFGAGPLQTHSEASGWLWVMGWVTMKSVHCTDTSGNGLAEISNRRGETIFLSYVFEQGAAVPPPLLMVDTKWTAYDGTGRFAGAYGSMFGSAFLQMILAFPPVGDPYPDISVPWPAKWTLDGVISY